MTLVLRTTTGEVVRLSTPKGREELVDAIRSAVVRRVLAWLGVEGVEVEE